MRFRLYNRVQHDVVFGIGCSPGVDELGFTHARPYIDKHLCVVRHPFLPLGLHFRFGFSPLRRIGLLPLGYDRRWGEVGDKKLFHPLLLLAVLAQSKIMSPATNAARLFLPSYLTDESTQAKPRLCECGNLTGCSAVAWRNYEKSGSVLSPASPARAATPGVSIFSVVSWWQNGLSSCASSFRALLGRKDDNPVV